MMLRALASRHALRRATPSVRASVAAFADSPAPPSSAPQLRLLDPTFDASTLSEPVRRIFELRNARNRDVVRAQASSVAESFRSAAGVPHKKNTAPPVYPPPRLGLHDADCGSTRVQIARLTVEIDALRLHCASHPKDEHSKRGFQAKLSARTRLLKYLRRESPQDYATTLTTLDLKPLKRRK
ncbi:ribosomal protein S15 [Aureococcus anophagefferens]|uniref:Ribosomal protein S15 n=2 Tax=Aureococcus anophagefferens TaxID=44056 RepID=A0ABR1FKI1_AURAN|mmetsp:Transcript_21131/g.72993  ORF Transcript_21131/g.72993 Transcript_21131/m.72993 type:complete len:183 (+) Transcript_21131:101-649(+)